MSLKKLILLSSVALAGGLNGIVHAASTAFEDPAGAAWGGWNRGDTGTVYAHWEEFDACVNAGGFCTPLPDDVPDAGASGFDSATVITNNPGAFITGNGLGGNIYSFSDTPDFDVIIDPDSNHVSGPVTAALQVAVVGTDLDFSSILLNGQAFNSVTTLATGMAGGPFGGAVNEYLFLWSMLGSEAAYAFDLTALGSSMSLDALSVDIGPAPVPIPAAVWLLGSGLLGLVTISRRNNKPAGAVS